MLGSATSDVAVLLLAAAALVIALAALLLVYRRGFQRVDVRIGAAHATLEAVARELKPNGGSSTRDVLDRLETWTIKADHRMDSLDHRLTSIEEAVTTPGGTS